MDEATLICARLLREGTVPRVEMRALDHPDVRAEVEQRLATVGLVLATSAYSEHVGIRLAPDVTTDHAFDAASNLGLKADACALLVILWARLVLQKRTAHATRAVPGAQQALLPEQASQAARAFVPQVRIAALAREFGPVLGSATHLKSLVTQLRKLSFVAGRGDVLEAGPLLELGIDGERMTAWIRREVLSQLVADQEANVTAEEDDVAIRLLAVVERLGGSASISDLEHETGEKRSRLRGVLKSLIHEGRLRQIGERNAARYQKVA